MGGTGDYLECRIFSLALSTRNSTGDEEKFEIAKKEFDSDVRTHASYFLILGAAIFLVSYIQMTFWTISGENQANVIYTYLFF